MALSVYAKNKILDHALGGTAWTQPVPWISLHTADPGATGAGEVAGGAGPYRRQSAAGKFAAAAGGSKASNAVLDFPGMPAVTVTHVGIWDAATAGNFIEGGALHQSKKIANVGDMFRLTTTDLVVTFTS